MPNGQGYIQARNIRNLAAAEVVAMLSEPRPDDATARCRRAMATAALIKGWESASDRMRILRGVALPGSKRPGPSKPPRHQRQSGLAQPQQPPP